MGNDGGDIPRRKQLVKQKQKVQIANAESIARGRARYCNLTNEKMKQPLAICKLGHIYNYEKILEALVQKHLPEKYCYIRKLTDIKKIKVERPQNESENFFVCPITKLEYNGLNKFVAVWECGHVFSRKAFKQVKIEGQKRSCIICLNPYEDKDLIDLNLDSQQIENKRKEIIKKQMQKKKMKKQVQKTEIQKQPRKKVKKDEIYVNSIDRLGGQFRAVVRQRSKFKELFNRDPN